MEGEERKKKERKEEIHIPELGLLGRVWLGLGGLTPDKLSQ
jgi:hypothetical protein